MKIVQAQGIELGKGLFFAQGNSPLGVLDFLTLLLGLLQQPNGAQQIPEEGKALPPDAWALLEEALPGEKISPEVGLVTEERSSAGETSEMTAEAPLRVSSSSDRDSSETSSPTEEFSPPLFLGVISEILRPSLPEEFPKISAKPLKAPSKTPPGFFKPFQEKVSRKAFYQLFESILPFYEERMQKEPLFAENFSQKSKLDVFPLELDRGLQKASEERGLFPDIPLEESVPVEITEEVFYGRLAPRDVQALEVNHGRLVVDDPLSIPPRVPRAQKFPSRPSPEIPLESFSPSPPEEKISPEEIPILGVLKRSKDFKGGDLRPKRSAEIHSPSAPGKEIPNPDKPSSHQEKIFSDSSLSKKFFTPKLKLISHRDFSRTSPLFPRTSSEAIYLGEKESSPKITYLAKEIPEKEAGRRSVLKVEPFSKGRPEESPREIFHPEEEFFEAPKPLKRELTRGPYPLEGPSRARERVQVPHNLFSPLKTANPSRGTEPLPLGNKIDTGSSRLPVTQIPDLVKDMVVEIRPSGERKAHLKLEPPDLGELDIHLRVHRQEATLFLQVEKPEALHQLQHQLPHLQHLLEDLGFQVVECQVSLGGAGQGWHFAREEKPDSEKGKPRAVRPVEEGPPEKERAFRAFSPDGQVNLVV